MKRKIILSVVFFAILFAVIMALAACSGGSDGSDDTYYEVKGYGSSATLDESSWVKLKGGKWTDNDGESGTYKLDGDKITILQDGEEWMTGTLKDGTLELEMWGIPAGTYRTKSAQEKISSTKSGDSSASTPEGDSSSGGNSPSSDGNDSGSSNSESGNTSGENSPSSDGNNSGSSGGQSGSNDKEPESYLREGNYIYFGDYPQTKMTDDSVTSALNAAAGTLPTASNSQEWTSYGYYIDGSVSNYMWYIDLEYSGEKYRGVYFTSYRPCYTKGGSFAYNSYQNDNGYSTSTVYWFKYEPIKWRILSEGDGEALILCEMIIDSQEYYNSTNSRTINGQTVYANNYAESNIRAWLNDTFYNTAFTDLQKQLILLTTVDNSARSTNQNDNATWWNRGNNRYACANTQDYVFLLSEQEVTNGAYGFDRNTARRKQNTDYAKSQGVWTSTYSEYVGNGYWWLRSPIDNDNNDSYFAQRVYCDGYYYYDIVGYTYGVVPALKIKLD